MHLRVCDRVNLARACRSLVPLQHDDLSQVINKCQLCTQIEYLAREWQTLRGMNRSRKMCPPGSIRPPVSPRFNSSLCVPSGGPGSGARFAPSRFDVFILVYANAKVTRRKPPLTNKQIHTQVMTDIHWQGPAAKKRVVRFLDRGGYTIIHNLHSPNW